MNNYTPTEIKDLQAIKQRVIFNVLQEIENGPRKPAFRWRFVILVILLSCNLVNNNVNDLEILIPFVVI